MSEDCIRTLFELAAHNESRICTLEREMRHHTPYTRHDAEQAKGAELLRRAHDAIRPPGNPAGHDSPHAE